MLSFNLFYVLYLLLITICRPALGLTLDINKEKYTKLSVVLFSCCFEGCKVPSSLFCSVISFLCRKPAARILHQLCKVLLLAIQWRVLFLLFSVLLLFCNCARGFYYSGYAVMSCDFWGML